MARPQPLELEVQRKGRRIARFDATADPADLTALRAALTDWLAGDGWDRKLWNEFELVARPVNGSKQLAKVRAT